MNPTASRWQRLADSLTEAGVPAFTSTRGPKTHYISINLHDGSMVEIHELWWRRNDKVWLGYNVHVEDRDSIVRRTWPTTKKHSEVVAAVVEATA